jgi:O-antigen/teichoic acid export membrane protein
MNSKLHTFFSRIMSIEPIRRQSIASLIWQIALTFIGFLSAMYFARAVGAGVLGAYFLFMAYFGIIGLMTDGGFGGAAVKRISEGGVTLRDRESIISDADFMAAAACLIK